MRSAARRTRYGAQGPQRALRDTKGPLQQRVAAPERERSVRAKERTEGVGRHGAGEAEGKRGEAERRE
jgi:hypothetical protein